MFSDTSRYARTPVDTVVTAGGRRVSAIRLRRLPSPPADPHTVIQGDRLDLLAQQHLGDGTRSWHIADANTTLEASALVGRILDTLWIPRP
ncbi:MULTISPECIES: hypothetical protein [Citricoccus]|uniref:hypothetical protein n=1 Tax=Citricoccus TaxID=169133 RepID=UPI000255F12A|nr:hypothetical protein [Citricoccus sp. CH26A]